MKKVLPNVYMISDYSNSYIVEFKNHLIIIDAGMDKKAKELIKAIEKIGKRPKAILITHAHLDHINGLAKLKEKYPEVEVVSSKEDRAAIEGKKVLLPKGIKGFFFKLAMPFMKYKEVKLNKTFREKYGEFKVIRTPGHTKGSVSLLFKKVLFCGDLLINSKGLCLPGKEFNLSEKQMIESIKKISKIEFNWLLTGHGNPVRIEKEKLNKFLKNIECSKLF
jgi:glyoxylase-like metal-dependent hydrolase (beta-lactamase superfamily II)